MPEEDLRMLVARIKDAGTRRISSDRLNIKPGIMESISEAFGDHPDKEALWRKCTLGNATGYHRLFSILEEICRQEKIAFEHQRY